jgi:biopolymer transport protein ExbD
MRKFRKTDLGGIKISTSSLPDIVFLLLSLLMVSATIKTEDDLVNYKVPNAEHLTKQK